jgi:uncharacterized membrane protein
MTTTGPVAVLITTFLASAVETVEMVTILVGVGATRGWRSTWIGAAAGFGVLGVVVAVGGIALRYIPIGPLRLVIGALLLVFGLQWFRKGVMRVAARGFAGYTGGAQLDEAVEWTGPGIDWTAFTLSFKGVTLEGLEIAILVVAFGLGANHLGYAVIGAAGALVLFGGAGVLLRGSVQRVPRSFLQLVVGVLLTTFGTFWSLEGLGVEWPGSDAAIVGLLLFYGLTALVFVNLERRRLFGLRPVV